MSEDLDVIIVAQVTNNLDKDSQIHNFLFFKGYWNFTVENPDGCQQCTCNPLGTVELGGGCNEDTGECQCKRNVARVRDCDQCLPKQFGLSKSDPNGCKPCDCDPGGSYNNQCDVTSGQCQCRPQLKVIQYYFSIPEFTDSIFREEDVIKWKTSPILDHLIISYTRQSWPTDLINHLPKLSGRSQAKYRARQHGLGLDTCKYSRDQL